MGMSLNEIPKEKDVFGTYRLTEKPSHRVGLWDKTKAYLKRVSMSCLSPGIYSLGFALSIDTDIDKHFLVF